MRLLFLSLLFDGGLRSEPVYDMAIGVLAQGRQVIG